MPNIAAFTSVTISDTGVNSLVVGGAPGATSGTGGIKAGQATFTAGLAIGGGTISTAGIVMPTGVPSTTTMALYNNSGTLTWNGIALATGASLSGTSGTVARFTSSNAVGDSILVESGGNLITLTGTMNATTAYQLNGTSINTGGTLTNVAYEDQANNFTNANGQTFGAGIGLSGGSPSTHGIHIPSAVPGVLTTNLHNSGGVLIWTGGGTFPGALTSSTLSVSGVVTGGTYNGQTITSTASLTGTLAVAGLLTVSANGTSTFGGASSANGENMLRVQNTTGTGSARIDAYADATNRIFLAAFGTTFTTSGVNIAASGLVGTDATNGMSVGALNAAGAIRFYSGGSTVRLTMATTGSLLSQLAAGASAPQWRFYSDHATNVELFLGNNAAANRTGVIGWNDTSAYGFLTVYGSANNFRWTASDFTRNGTAYTNPDYVLEHWATGSIVHFADREGAAQYDGLRTLADVEASARTTYALPRIADWRAGKAGGNGIFGGGDACLASIEEAYLYLFQHDATINQLAARLAALEGKQ